jgi:hypothetical protein
MPREVTLNIKPQKGTFFKRKPQQETVLNDSEKCKFENDTTSIVCIAIDTDLKKHNSHWKVILQKDLTAKDGKSKTKDWYVFPEHVDVVVVRTM